MWSGVSDPGPAARRDSGRDAATLQPLPKRATRRINGPHACRLHHSAFGGGDAAGGKQPIASAAGRGYPGGRSRRPNRGRPLAKVATRVSVGQSVRVREGLAMPEFPAIPIGGLGGSVTEVRGRGKQRKVILRWTEESMARLPNGYRDECDAKQLAADLVCLLASDVVVVE